MEIIGLLKAKFRGLVKTKIEKIAAKYLNEIKYNHSKTQNLKFEGFKPAKYLLSNNLTTEEIQTLFKLRTRMVNVKENFKNGHIENMWCRNCQLFKETQQHLLECPILRSKTKHLIKFEELEYNMIFGSLKNQEKFTKSYHLLNQE